MLRAALAARVDGMEPSPGVWEQVRTLAQQPEPRPSRWPWRRGDGMALGRSLTAMAGTGLALVLALNTQIVTVPRPLADPSSPSVVQDQDGGPLAWDRLPLAGGDGTAPSRQAPSIEIDAQPDPEGLVMNVDAGQVLASITSSAPQDPVAEPAGQVIVLVRLPLAPEPPPAQSQHDGDAGDDTVEAPEPSPLPAGAPT